MSNWLQTIACYSNSFTITEFVLFASTLKNFFCLLVIHVMETHTEPACLCDHVMAELPGFVVLLV